MVTKLELGKKFILDLIEQSVAAYDQREEICNKIQNLEDKGQIEHINHMQVISYRLLLISNPSRNMY